MLAAWSGFSRAYKGIYMEENKRPDEYGDVEMKSPTLTKLSNFWYHYKWHSIVALFLVLVIVVCSVQFCSKMGTEIDVYITYAGPRNMKSALGASTGYEKMIGVFSGCKIGEESPEVSFMTLNIISPAEREEILKEDPTTEVISPAEDTELFEYHVFNGMGKKYFVTLMSPYVYDTYSARYSAATEGGNLFADISSYLDADYTEYELHGTGAVKISSTAIYKNNADLRAAIPADTLIAIRVNNALFGSRDAASYDKAEEFLRVFLAN